MVMPRSRSSGALSIESNERNLILGLCFDNTLVIAAVNVVFPWSMCPIVPTLTCGFVRSNFSFAIASPQTLMELPRLQSVSVIAINFSVLLAHLRIDLFDPLQVKLAHQGLIRKRERLIQRPGLLSRLRQRAVYSFQNSRGRNLFELAHVDRAALQLAVKPFNRVRCQDALQSGLQLLKLFRLVDRDLCLLVRHPLPVVPSA